MPHCLSRAPQITAHVERPGKSDVQPLQACNMAWGWTGCGQSANWQMEIADFCIDALTWMQWSGAHAERLRSGDALSTRASGVNLPCKKQLQASCTNKHLLCAAAAGKHTWLRASCTTLLVHQTRPDSPASCTSLPAYPPTEFWGDTHASQLVALRGRSLVA